MQYAHTSRPLACRRPTTSRQAYRCRHRPCRFRQTAISRASSAVIATRSPRAVLLRVPHLLGVRYCHTCGGTLFNGDCWPGATRSSSARASHRDFAGFCRLFLPPPIFRFHNAHGRNSALPSIARTRTHARIPCRLALACMHRSAGAAVGDGDPAALLHRSLERVLSVSLSIEEVRAAVRLRRRPTLRYLRTLTAPPPPPPAAPEHVAAPIDSRTACRLPHVAVRASCVRA